VSSVHDRSVPGEVERLANTIFKLQDERGARVALLVIDLATAISREAIRSSQFAERLATPAPDAASGEEQPRRRGRREPASIDPFALYADGGEEGLQARLRELTLEQLRDVLAEHRMDQDRLGMKWKDKERVASRIVERVSERATKGWAFNGPPPAVIHDSGSGGVAGDPNE